MKKIITQYEKDNVEYHLDDKIRIRKILSDRGFSVTLKQAQDLWACYSDSWAASWLALPENDEDIFEYIRPYFEEQED